MSITTTHVLSGTFVADPSHSSFQFTVRHMKVSLFRASFGDVDARLSDQTGRLVLEGTARADSVSISTPAELREHIVYGEEFFDARRHPQITVRSQEIQFAEDGTLAARGELTVRGVTRPVTASGTWSLPVEDPFGSRRMGVEVGAVVDRRDWGLDWQLPMPGGGDVLAYEVRLDAHIELLGS